MAIGSTTAAIVAIVAAVASAASSAYSSYAQGQMQKKAANYNATVAENNARAASMQAAYDAQRLKDRNRRIAAKQRTTYAKSGVSIIDGSAFDVQYDSAIQGELDNLAVIYRGNVAATGYRGEASYLRASGRNAAQMGNYQAGATLLTSAAQSGADYASMTRKSALTIG